MGVLTIDVLWKGFSGFVNHAQMAPLYGAFLLAFFPANHGLAIGGGKALESPGVYRLPIDLIAAAVMVAYAFIGIRRIRAGGVEMFEGGPILTYVYVQAHRDGAYAAISSWGVQFLELSGARTVLAVGFVIITLFEVLSPVCLISNWFRRMWLMVMIPFHVSTLFLMGIFFWENILIILVVLTSIPQRIARRIGSFPARPYQLT